MEFINMFSVYAQSGTHSHFNWWIHDDVIKWKHFPRNWPFVRGIHWSPVNPPHKGQWRGALMFSLICIWINGWVNNREAGDLSRYHAHYDVAVMYCGFTRLELCVHYFFLSRLQLYITAMVKVKHRQIVMPSISYKKSGWTLVQVMDWCLMAQDMEH